MSAPGLQMYVLPVALTHGGRPIVGFQDMAEIIIVDGEQARIG